MKAKFRTFLIVVSAFALILSACGGRPSATADTSPVQTAAVQTFQAQQPAASPTPNLQTQVAQSVAATLGAPVSGQDTSAYEGTETCEDGKNTTPLFFEKPTDVPWGTNKGATVAEIAWKPGAGWYRIIAIAERILGIEMPYANGILTLYVTQYCGSLQAIKDWAPTHVTAMINSSQNSAGDRPSSDEIPIVLLKRDGTIEWVKMVPNGPSLAEIQAHLEMRP